MCGGGGGGGAEERRRRGSSDRDNPGPVPAVTSQICKSSQLTGTASRQWRSTNHPEHERWSVHAPVLTVHGWLQKRSPPPQGGHRDINQAGGEVGSRGGGGGAV